MKYIGKKIEGKEYIERRASYGLIFNDDGELAVVYFKENDMYNMPGGKIEFGENSKQTLIRECEEEIAYSLKDIEYIGDLGCYYYFDIGNKYELAIMDVYRAKIGERIRDSFEEGAELVWVKPEDIAGKMYFPYHRYIINDYLGRNK